MMSQTVDTQDSRANGLPPSDCAWRGIDLCREGDWQEGFYWLSLAADSSVDTNAVPSLFFAFLGYGLAKIQGQVSEGVRLCRRAVDLDIYQPESYLYLASTLLLAGDRRSAIDAVEQGLQIDATHEGLRLLKIQLGRRRQPVLPFLDRQNFVNRSLGLLRHRLFGPTSSA